MKITRRDFVKNCALFLGTLPGSGIFIDFAEKSFAASPKPILAVVEGSRIQATKRAIALLGGMNSFVKKGDRVVLKPNMSFPHPPARATNTHPEVVSTIARMCINSGAKEVLVLDFPFNRPEPCLRKSGIADACEKIPNVYTFALTEEKFFRNASVHGGKVLKDVKIMKDVLTCDVFINIPTAKSHTTTGVSLGMKGLMGIIWDRKFFHTKVDINQAIADLASIVRIHLTILDASRALTNGGPSGPGTVVYPNTIVAGKDPVAVDAMGASLVKWYGQKFKPNQVKHIAAAHKMGIGTMNLNEITILRERV